MNIKVHLPPNNPQIVLDFTLGRLSIILSPIREKKICKLIDANICKQCLHAVQQTNRDEKILVVKPEKKIVKVSLKFWWKENKVM